jgi:hypothetical protein
LPPIRVVNCLPVALGCCSPAPGRYLYLHTLRDANCQSWTPASHAQAVCCGAHARVWRRVQVVHVGRTLVPPLHCVGRETGLQSLLRVRVSALSAPPNSSVIALQLRQHGRRASCPYVLAASLQVWNGVMVLLGAARFGPRRNAPDPPRRLHLQRTRQLRLSKCMMLLYHPPPSDVCEPSPSKGVERRGGVSPSAELAAAGRWS